jgi:hypothetical protein
LQHTGKDQPTFSGAAEPSFVARVKFGLSDFLFGSFSALFGSKHGIPRRSPPRRIEPVSCEFPLFKTEHPHKKAPR